VTPVYPHLNGFHIAVYIIKNRVKAIYIWVEPKNRKN